MNVYTDYPRTNQNFFTSSKSESDQASLSVQEQQKFIAMMSHDLRTPLTAVMGFLDLLEMGIHGNLNESASRGLLSSRASISRVINLVNDLLNYESLNSGKMTLRSESLKVSELYRDTFDSISLIAQLKRIRLDFEPTELTLNCDRQRLAQVLVNLVANAVKFSPAGETVSIKAKRTKSGSLEVSVIDNGPGIAEDKAKRVFEPFFQVEEGEQRTNNQGNGVGLALSKMIVEAHGGTIGVDSKIGKGSRFWFRIPG
ncbi:hypothetical protein GC174_16395 [bacterium]|nr:hypothetical protein [bacterium]